MYGMEGVVNKRKEEGMKISYGKKGSHAT